MSSSVTSQAARARETTRTPLISVRSLSKSFSGPGGRPLPVLDDINLDVAEGEFVALLGRSGSGKSTLLRCIAGLMAPTSGAVMFRGERLTGTNRETSMVFQTFALMPWLTVQGNVELGLEARGVPPEQRAERALRAIDIVGLDGYESAYPKELSGGMRQRVGFARALVVEPAALLMDEPFSALDVLTSENLRGELLELWEGHRFPTKTIVMVTHNIEEAVLLADRILVLGTNPGRIREDMVNPLPRPRLRRTPDFDELVDHIYRLMTHREQAAAEPARQGAGTGTVGDTPLPQASVDGLSGLAEILLARHGGAADLADLADNLGLEVDDLLPLVDALVLLGFADLRGDRLDLSGAGHVFAGASIQDSKEIFARASLDRAPLVRTIYRALRGSVDGNLPAGFFTDILRNSFGAEDAARQLDVAVNWGRYAELYDYDATRGQIKREQHGIGATIADAPQRVTKGSLTLYLGAAPGSGKTFTMLREGRELRSLGDDVVIGFVDTRGREHTQEAIGGLEIVPPRLAEETHGIAPEMNLAAVLARKPGVALVDDLGTHAGAIEALREAGVDVISTADVTDVERCAAEVEAITGRRPAARITDDVLAGVDALQFVDSSPEALRKRLGHGNIYPRELIDAALRTEFQPARLAALRELGLQLVAEGVQAGQVRQRVSQDVLVTVRRPAHADALVLRGVRLARMLGSRCTVLAVSQPGGSAELDRRAEAAATAAGASVLSREGHDIGTVVAVVQETGSRHLVLAAPSAGVLDRWRVTRLDRLVAALPEVHLHIQAPGGLTAPDVPPEAAGQQADGANGAGRRGEIRVYLGYAPGCGTTTAMLEEALRRQSRGTDVVLAGVQSRDREQLTALVGELEVIGAEGTLDTEAVLARRPEVACVDELTAGTTTTEPRIAAARRLADAGITVVGTVQLGRLDPAAGPDGRAGVGSAGLDENALIAVADEIELVDVPPSILVDRVRRGLVVPPDQVDEALQTTYAMDSLRADRERTFRLVGTHGDRQLAAYSEGDRDALPLTAHERWPSILACLSPQPGMERLIRRSAALAAQVDGVFRAAVVQRSQPGPQEDQMLLDYAALTEQLGGEFVVLDGPAEAATLARYAAEHQVTELVLARSRAGSASRNLTLRELSRLTGGTEVHVLPDEPAE
jgi:NitT/TauT family transport system ATP-binding protein